MSYPAYKPDKIWVLESKASSKTWIPVEIVTWYSLYNGSLKMRLKILRRRNPDKTYRIAEYRMLRTLHGKDY